MILNMEGAMKSFTAINHRVSGQTSKVSLPLVSVVMNCLDCERFLKEAIESVYEQTYTNWEIIFWDNASTDRSAEIAHRYDAKLRYFRGQDTVRLGEARNKAVEEARGEFIAFLDCDDIWMPQKLERQLAAFNSERIGLVICDAIFFNQKGKTKRLYKKGPPPTGRVFQRLLQENFICMGTMVVRKAVFESLDHWFDTRFDLIEEYDFNIRLSYSWEIGYVDEILAKWRVHQKSFSWSRNNLLPKERRLMLNKLKLALPHLTIDYPYQMRAIERQIHWEEAKLLLQKGDSTNAFRHFRPYMKDGFLWRIRGMALGLPFFWFRIIHRMVTKISP